MKKLLFGGALCALAAAAPAHAAQLYNWSGFYIGVNAGGAWSSTDVTYAPAYSAAPAGFPAAAAANGSLTLDASSFTGGAQIGYNSQFSNWVLGIEADFNYARLSKSVNSGVLTFPGVTNYFFDTSTSSNWIATLRPRLGLDVGFGLIYVTGGLAVADLSFSQNITFIATATGTGSARSTQVGWTVGGGFEYAIAPQWSAKVEYLHSEFGTLSFPATVTTALIASSSRARTDIDIVRVGINWRIGRP